MAEQTDDNTEGVAARKHIDELEQLRTSLESALEDNTRLHEERDRLLTRVDALSRELRTLHYERRQEKVPAPPPPAPPPDDQEEELRVAFEELQVLTEELEVANTTLQQANEELDARVEERTFELNKVNATLRAAEESFRAITNLVPDLLWRGSADGTANWFNQRWFDYTGSHEQDSLGLTMSDAVHPMDRAAVESAWARAVKHGEPFESEHRLRNAQGEYRWFLARIQPLRDEAGQVQLWYGAATDIHDQRMAMNALRQSELRFRTLIEGVPQLVWRAVDTGKWTWSSPQWTDYTGQPEEESHAAGWLEMFHARDRQNAMGAWQDAEADGLLEFEGRILHREERRYRHFRTRAMPVRDAKGQIVEWLGTCTDVDDIVQLQAQQSVLLAELQHRTRNLMAVIQAVVKRTISDSNSITAFHERFEDRLMSLARVQGLLSHREAGTRVAFDKVLRGELAAYVSLDASGNGHGVTTRGPEGVPLRSATVQTLTLALHELTTNAVKYGALGQDGGRLHIAWRVIGEGDEPRRLFVDWRESGVANMPDPEARARGGGYGRELIERALPHQLGARTSYSLEPDGVHCTIEVDIPVDEPAAESSLQEKVHG